MRTRIARVLPLAVAVMATIAARVALLSSEGSFGFDEGTYGMSVLAMRDGLAPFQEVFSSQGPLFLPLLRLADLIAPDHVLALRLTMLVAAVATTIAVYSIACRFTSAIASGALASVVGVSGTVLLAAGPVQSDGPALALGTWAVALALGVGGLSGRSRVVLTGVLLGAAVAVKSLLVVPAGLAIAWVWWQHRDRAAFLMGSGSAAAVVFLTALPWGLGAVWRQSVAFHLDIPRDRDPVGNIAELADALWRLDVAIVGLVLLGLLALLVSRLRDTEGPGDSGDRIVVVVWLLAALLVLVFTVELGSGFERYVAFLVVPMALGVAAASPKTMAVVAVSVALVPVVVLQNSLMVDPIDLDQSPRTVADSLSDLPEGALIVTDEPGLAWIAGVRPPGGLVDLSWARILAGSVTSEEVIQAVARGDVCAVMVASGRLDWLVPGLENALLGYELEYEWGDDSRLFVRPTCSP